MINKGRPRTITQDSIASQCLELYWNKGIHNVTYNEVIKYSRVSKGTVYNLFKSEDELQAKTLECYEKKFLNELAHVINNQDDLLDFVELMFNFIRSKFCYFVVTNSNRYMLNDLTKAYTVKIENKFKKLIYNLIIRHVKKFNLVPQTIEIFSLAIYLRHNITLANILKLNKADRKDLLIIKNAMREKIEKSFTKL